MNEVKVNKGELLTILRKNLEIHSVEHAELMVEYKKAITKEIAKQHKRAQKGLLPILSKLNKIEKPNSYAEYYTEAIAMLEMSVDDELVLTAHQFKQYVLDEWSWTNSFAMTKSAYGK